jgi:predicted Zn-dependent protease
MSNLFKRLQDDQNSVIPEFLSSHPVTKERIRNSNKGEYKVHWKKKIKKTIAIQWIKKIIKNLKFILVIISILKSWDYDF